MIRLIYALRRSSDVSFEAFQQTWKTQHAAIYQEKHKALGFSRYSQFHSLQDPESATADRYRGVMAKPFDGVTELWFESQAAAEDFLNSEIWKDDIYEDEKRFVDHAESAAWIAYDCPQVNPTPETIIASTESSLIKLFYLLKAPEGQQIEDIQWYWRVQHGPLVRSVASDIQALRYIQVHRVNDDINQQIVDQRGTAEAFYGHAELWFDTERAVASAEKAEAAAKLLYEDEMKFIDFPSSTSWVGKELVLVRSATVG